MIQRYEEFLNESVQIDRKPIFYAQDLQELKDWLHSDKTKGIGAIKFVFSYKEPDVKTLGEVWNIMPLVWFVGSELKQKSVDGRDTTLTIKMDKKFGDRIKKFKGVYVYDATDDYVNM